MKHHRPRLNDIEREFFEKYKNLPFFDTDKEDTFLNKASQLKRVEQLRNPIENVCNAYFNGYKSEPKYTIGLTIDKTLLDTLPKELRDIILVENKNGDLSYVQKNKIKDDQKSAFTHSEILKLNDKIHQDIFLPSFETVTKDTTAKTEDRPHSFEKAKLNSHELRIFEYYKNTVFYSTDAFTTSFIDHLYTAFSDPKKRKHFDDNFIDRMIRAYFNGYETTSNDEYVVMMPKSINVQIHYTDSINWHATKNENAENMFLAEYDSGELTWTNCADIEEEYTYIFSQKKINELNKKVQGIDLNILKAKASSVGISQS